METRSFANVSGFTLKRETSIDGRGLRRHNLKRPLFALAVILFLAIVSALWWQVSTSPAKPKVTTTQQFVISKGDGVREIAKKLKDQSLIRDQVAFFLLIKKLNIEKNIQAGTFQLSPSMSASDIALALTSGTEDIWITVPEGWRSEEILGYLGAQGFNTEGVDWRADEGKLFPDTYRIPKQSSVSAIRALLRQTFDSKTTGLKISSQTLILASMVEREAKFASDRPKVASVLLNRLSLGMKLDIDATVQYALGKPGNWWPKELSLEDLKVKSPYNTYINAGLPPAPIANPGLSAIQAVINPTQTDYLYYVSDKAGHLHFASTLEDHNANVAKYLGQ